VTGGLYHRGMSMEETTASYFEQVLNSTVRMIRNSWNVPVCLFIQMDDSGMLRVRASDRLPASLPATVGFKPNGGLVARCLEKSQVLTSNTQSWDDGMEKLLSAVQTEQAKTFVLVPVAGQARTLGVLVLGPVADFKALLARESELRGAGNL